MEGGIGMLRRMMEGRRGVKLGIVGIRGMGKLNRQQEDFAEEFGRFSFRKFGETGRVLAGRRGDKMRGGKEVAEIERERACVR